MRLSGRLINFALLFCLLAGATCISGCKGRTMENMVPKGETIEVVVKQDTIVKIRDINTNINQE